MATKSTEKETFVTTKEVAAYLSKTTGRKISAFALRTYLRQPGHYADAKYTRYRWPSLQHKEIAQLETEIKDGKFVRKPKAAKKTSKVVAKAKGKPAAKKTVAKKVAPKSKASSPKASQASAPAAKAE